MKTCTFEERFWAKVEKTDSCWVWTASTDRTGYGKIAKEGKLTPAHRVSWSMVNGDIPEGMMVDHLCHNHGCVNPDHLRLATMKQNQENRRSADRDSKSGIRGVYQIGRRWVAEVRSNGNLAYRERFDTIEEAAKAVAKARARIFTHSQEGAA